MRRIIRLRVALELLDEARDTLKGAYSDPRNRYEDDWYAVHWPIDQVIDKAKADLGRLEAEALETIKQRQVTK